MKWLRKNYSKVIFILLLGLVIYFLFFGKEDFSDKYTESVKRYNVSQQKLDAARNTAAEKDVRAEKERAEHKKYRADKDKEIAELKSDKVVLSKKLIAEKEKVKFLPDDAIVTAINQRVGEGEAKLLYSGMFSLKRPGAETTVRLFIDGEFCLKAREKDSLEIKKLNEKDAKWTETEKNYQQQLIDKDTLLIDTDLTLLNCDKSLKRLEKDFKKSKWKKRGEGLVGGIILGLLIKNVIGG